MDLAFDLPVAPALREGHLNGAVVAVQTFRKAAKLGRVTLGT
jgi:hypothetical protein